MRSIGYKNISSFTIIFFYSTFKLNSIEHVFYGIKSTVTSTFNGFLLAAQQETASEKSDEVDLDVYLMNDSKISIRGLTVLQTEEVLEVSKSRIIFMLN